MQLNSSGHASSYLYRFRSRGVHHSNHWRYSGFVGVTSMDTSVAEVTVKAVDAETPPRVAEILVGPGAAVVVIPFAPGVLLIDATVLTERTPRYRRGNVVHRIVRVRHRSRQS